MHIHLIHSFVGACTVGRGVGTPSPRHDTTRHGSFQGISNLLVFSFSFVGAGTLGLGLGRGVGLGAGIPHSTTYYHCDPLSTTTILIIHTYIHTILYLN